MAGTPIERLDQSFAAFMKYYFVFLNPVLHRAVYRGRSYSDNQIVVIMALHGYGPQRPTDLSRGLSLQKGSLTTILRKLREFGLIERLTTPGEERSYQVRVTAAGRAFARHMEAQRQQGFATLFQGMAPDQVRDAARGIELLTGFLRQREEASCSKRS